MGKLELLPDKVMHDGQTGSIGCWSALADDFRTFLLNPDIFELTLSAAYD
jgi:hypothetical protein